MPQIDIYLLMKYTTPTEYPTIWLKFKDSRMGPFSGDFQRGGDSERNIPYFNSARYIGPILHASLHVYCMGHNSVELMRWVPPLDMIDVLFTFTFYKTYK